MSPMQLWRMLWARKLLIAATTVFCMLGGIAVIFVVPPRWNAEANVMLNILKPDPVTGEIISGPASRSYIATQIELITDYNVVGRAIDSLGWLSDPNFIAAYQGRPSNDTRDFRHWLAQLIIDRTQADVGVSDTPKNNPNMQGSSILTITYTGTTPDNAKAVADALMHSYLDTSLVLKRQDAIKAADWYLLQAEKAKEALDKAQAVVTKFERDNGVVMTEDNRTDIDSVRLSAMAQQGLAAGGLANGSSIDSQLAEIDAEIKTQSAILGPNNPEMQALYAKRSALAGLVAQEHKIGSRAAKSQSPIDSQKALVISERGKLANLENLQTEVDVRRDFYNRTLQKESDYRQQAAAVDAGLTSLGDARVPASPAFPNIPLIIGGCFALGLALGTLLALLVELLNRRIRSAEDLIGGFDIPLLSVLEKAH